MCGLVNARWCCGDACCLHFQVGRLPAGTRFLQAIVAGVLICELMSPFDCLLDVTHIMSSIFSLIFSVGCHESQHMHVLCACAHTHTCTQKMLLNQWSDCHLIEHNNFQLSFVVYFILRDRKSEQQVVYWFLSVTVLCATHITLTGLSSWCEVVRESPEGHYDVHKSVTLS